MLRPVPEEWAHFLPGYGVTRALFDASLTLRFDETASLTTALAWLSGLLIVATLVLIRGGVSR